MTMFWRSSTGWIKVRRSILHAVLAAWGIATVAEAQELEPRSYMNIPIDQQFLIVGVGRNTGEVSPSPTAPVDDVKLDINLLALAYARSFDLMGKSAKFDVQTFRTCYEGSGLVLGNRERVDRCEWGDARFRLSWNLVGAPALSLEDFRRLYKPGFTLGASVQVEAPIGDYKAERLINAGTNRWMLRPGLGMSYQWGAWYADFSLDVKLFQDNDNYLGDRIKQDPIYQAQFHVVRYFPRGIWLAFNSNFYRGGESFKQGEPLLDELENSRLGLAASFPLGKHHSLKFNVSRGVVTRIGSDFDAVSLSYQYRF